MKTGLIYLCGIHALAFLVFHAFFWKIFDWKNDLQKNTLANRAIIQIANLRLMYLFAFVAFLCFFFPNELAETILGSVLLAGFSLFWLGRLIEQFIFLRVNHWLVHLLTSMFVLGAILFALPLVVQ